VAETR